MSPSSTDPAAPFQHAAWGLGRRAAAALVVGALIVGGMVHLGNHTSQLAATIHPCETDMAACVGQTVLIANRIVISSSPETQSVEVKVPTGVVELSPWPASLPFPRPGAVLSAWGRQEAEGRIIPDEVLVQQFRVLKLAVSGIVSLSWGLFAILLALRRRTPPASTPTAAVRRPEASQDG